MNTFKWMHVDKKGNQTFLTLEKELNTCTDCIQTFNNRGSTCVCLYDLPSVSCRASSGMGRFEHLYSFIFHSRDKSFHLFQSIDPEDHSPLFAILSPSTKLSIYNTGKQIKKLHSVPNGHVIPFDPHQVITDGKHNWFHLVPVTPPYHIDFSSASSEPCHYPQLSQHSDTVSTIINTD